MNFIKHNLKFISTATVAVNVYILFVATQYAKKGPADSVVPDLLAHLFKGLYMCCKRVHRTIKQSTGQLTSLLTKLRP